METFKFYCAHNQYSHALPSIFSLKGNEVTFYPEKISAALWEKLKGKMGIVELTIAEANEIAKAKRAVIRVSDAVLKNLFS